MSFPNYNQLNEWPLQFLRTGYYYRSGGYLSEHTTAGGWWIGAAGSTTSGRRLGDWAGSVSARGTGWRGYGFALRGVAYGTA